MFQHSGRLGTFSGGRAAFQASCHPSMKRDISKIPLLGVTGSIGSGKSAVCAFLQRRFSFRIIDADVICRNLMEKEREGWQHFVEEFGGEYLHGKGDIDRRKLRLAVFADSSLRKRLENILHPLARKEMIRQAELLLTQGWPVLAEIPLLFEAGWQKDVDRIVVVYAEKASRLARVCKRDNITREQAGAMEESQMPVIHKIMAADHVIDNSGTWCETVLQLLRLGSIYAEIPCAEREKKLDRK